MLVRMLSNEKGTIAVLASVLLFVVAVTVSLLVTAADTFAIKKQAQGALDSAVIAGASAPTSYTDSQIIALAQELYASNRNKRTDAVINIRVLGNGSSNFTVTPTLVIGHATFEVSSPFVGLFGRSTVAITVDGSARRAFGSPMCVLGLDPTEAETIDMNGKADVNIMNCAVMANTRDGSGIHQVGQPHLKAKDIGVNGGYVGTGYEPQPKTGVASIDDPLAALPQPVPGPCHPRSGAKLLGDVLTLTPGTYCGGITIQAGSVVTLEPGIYIMQDGPMSIAAQSSVAGHEVMIAFLGPGATLQIDGGGSLNVTSPTSGTYANIQFFGDRTTYPGQGNGGNSDSLWFTVIGDSQLTYDGVLYTPTFHIWWAGGSLIRGSSPNYLAIAKKLWFQDNTQAQLVKENLRGLDVTEPVSMGSGAVLFQ